MRCKWKKVNADLSEIVSWSNPVCLFFLDKRNVTVFICMAFTKTLGMVSKKEIWRTSYKMANQKAMNYSHFVLERT